MNRIDSQIDDMHALIKTVERRLSKRRQMNQDVTPIVRAVVKGFESDPGTSDLDNEQPINVQMTLGDWRKARRLLYDLEEVDEKRLAELERQSGCSDA